MSEHQKLCDLKGCGEPAIWCYVTWDDEQDGPHVTCNVDLCAEHAERYKDHDSVLQKIKYTGIDVGDLLQRVVRLEAKVKRLEDKNLITNEFNE